MTDTRNLQSSIKTPPIARKLFVSLQGRMLFVLLGLTIAYGTGVWAIRNWQSHQVDTTLRGEVIQKQNFFAKLLELRGRPLYSFVFDYTYWDEMVQFVEEVDSTWAEENIVASMPTFDAKAVWVFDPDFKLVYHTCEFSDSLVCVSSLLGEAYRSLFAGTPLTHFFTNSPAGLLEFRGATVHPTDDAERCTAPRGYFFAASVWDEEFLQELGELANGQVTLQLSSAIPEQEGGEYDRTGRVSWRKALYGWDNKPLAMLHAETLSSEVQQQLHVAKLMTVLSALLTLILLSFAALVMTRWVVLPLRRISGSLAAEELAPIRGLLSHRTEFGHIAQLIQQFFQQKSELVQEIEERKRAEKEKEHLQSQLERTQRLQTIGTLAGGVAHNFNNLLTPIVGYADMVLRQIEQDDSMRPNIEQIAQAGSRAKDLVREILTFSRSGEQERSLSQLHLLFKEALKLVHASVPPNVEIRENLDESCGAVFCDASQMHQVLMNLCTNAFHAMREKGGILEVTLDSLEVGHDLSWLRLNLNPGYYVRLTVSDTGCGMDRATMERIFEPFFTTKDAGEGVGLGLSVLHGIVLAHGGAVTVYSEPGKGTTFRIYLPAQRQGTQKASPEARPVPAGGESVLFVDDEPIIVNMGKQMLEKLGYRVTAVTSGEEALRLFRDKPGEFDILITDQTMPCITGDRLAKEVLNLRPDLPIVMITGFSQCVTTVNYRELGIREYVMKPLLMRELSEAIRRAVELQPEAVN